MKTEFTDISDTQKKIAIEIPGEVVDAKIDRVTRDFSRSAKIPGFRPGKVPTKLIQQRFREQIFHEVTQGLIPNAVEETLRERGLEPVDTPNIRDVVVNKGSPLTFTATFETVPPIDPGDYAVFTLRRPPILVEEEAIDKALSELRERSARFDPVSGRLTEQGDSVVLDLTREVVNGPNSTEVPPEQLKPDTHKGVTIEIGASANPPGFDDEIIGLDIDDVKEFTLSYPTDHATSELAGTTVRYDVRVKAIKRRNLPELDDEFAKDIGDFENLGALRTRVSEDLKKEAEQDADRQVRAELVKQLAERITFNLPEALVNRELDRRVEEFVRRLLEQRVDPKKANINWEEFREQQREPAQEAVCSALVIDEIARRESLSPSEEDIESEVARYAERSGRPTATVRAKLEQEGGMARVEIGLRREKAMNLLLSRAKIITV
ncbi:MAG: trigger factor [Dehalococcoidia bacterium]|jgi:trigger factor|nr:trigger factor [Acidobacteriota bacterium]MDP7210351.1 trigger factor [Vicinamibacterales bacterium]MDP7486372.1 trigger factor [Dehalococcoidia bacterium]HJO17181.1 trigger factor [Vicinamibacterales bacterium]|tara:strand:+ start:934 stop:2241 length:1308 start_codon:yes stop_codon:yes gene_type:complete